MSTATLAVVAPSTPAVTTDQIDLVKRTVANGATDAELKLFLFDCQRQGVHPLDRLIHFTKRNGKYTPITSIDFMRTRAADTGEYAGSDDAVFVGAAQGPEWAATVTVWRLVQGQRCAFTSTARWSEYKPDQDFMWKKMPHTMLAKCAEALALRKGFPRQLAGLYAAEEMAQAGPPTGIVTDLQGHEGKPEKPSAANGGELAAPSIIDTTTGEEKLIPPGWHAVHGYTFRSGWHEFKLLNYTVNGDPIVLSTKKQIGALAERACAKGIPVQVTITPKRGRTDEAYVDTITLYKAEPDAPAGEVDGGKGTGSVYDDFKDSPF